MSLFVESYNRKLNYVFLSKTFGIIPPYFYNESSYFLQCEYLCSLNGKTSNPYDCTKIKYRKEQNYAHKIISLKESAIEKKYDFSFHEKIPNPLLFTVIFKCIENRSSIENKIWRETVYMIEDDSTSLNYFSNKKKIKF